MSKNKTTKAEPKKEVKQAFFFPREDRTIMATSREEALKILHGNKE